MTNMENEKLKLGEWSLFIVMVLFIGSIGFALGLFVSDKANYKLGYEAGLAQQVFRETDMRFLSATATMPIKMENNNLELVCEFLPVK